MTRLGVYGGSFDPIHRGHIDPVLAAVDQLDLDRVLYLPTAQPPHKPGVRFAPVGRRFAMVEIALLDHSRLEVSDLEMSERPTYTVETLERLRQEDPDAELYLLVGSDSLAEIEGWRRWRALFDLAQIAVLRRPGWSEEAVEAAASSPLHEAIRRGAVWIDNEPFDVSATMIRERLRAGKVVPPNDVPASVVQYAVKYGLYS